MSNKHIRGVPESKLKTALMMLWRRMVEVPEHDGQMILICTGDTYRFFGDDARAAAMTLGGELQTRSGVPVYRIPADEVRTAGIKIRAAGGRFLIVGGPPTPSAPKGHYRAHVDATIGNRRMSNFMANAGLGLSGVGCKERLVLNYAPGEKVDAERVNAAMDNMIAAADAAHEAFKILSFKLVKLEFVND